MFKVHFLFFLFIFSFGAVCFSKKNQITPFQENIKKCVVLKEDILKIQNLDQLYQALDKQFDLKTNETIYREVLFKEKADLKKLKFQDNKITIYKVTSEGQLLAQANDPRQKGLTDEAVINQLLQHAEVRSDWLKVKEVRSGNSLLYFSREDGQYKSITFEKLDSKMKLECSNKDTSDICLCRL